MFRISVLSLVGALTLSAASLPAQSSPAPVDSFLVLVPLRAPGAVAQEVAEFKDLQQRAQVEGAQADLLQRLISARIDQAGAEMDRLKDKAKAAKSAGDEAARVTADADRKAVELRRHSLERREDLRKAEVNLANARKEYAERAIQALSLEQTLQERRLERGAAPSAGTLSALQVDNGLALLERQVLEAQRKQAETNTDVADLEKQLIERRISLLETRNAM